MAGWVKKIAVVMSLVVLGMVSASCNTIGVESDAYFTVVQSFDTGNGTTVVMYANDTKVMYVWRVFSSYYSKPSGFSVLYNADGSIKIWNGE